MKKSSLLSSSSAGRRKSPSRESALWSVREALLRRKALALAGPALRPSAVLVLLYPRNGDYCILLNRRTDKVEFSKGEICFPGGVMDPQDEDYTATALRETFEEMGIRPDDVTLLGELDDTPTRTELFIHPLVGTIPHPYQFSPSVDEVAEVLETPVASLLEGNGVRHEARLTSSGQLMHTRSYACGGHLIYGATARILQQLVEVLEGCGWPREISKA